jgi:hypothetical protein
VNVGQEKHPWDPPTYNAPDSFLIKASGAAKACFEKNRLPYCHKIHGRPCKPGNMQNIFDVSCCIKNQKNTSSSILSLRMVSLYPSIVMVIKFF